MGGNVYEIVVDNFAGGGGASTGIEMALGRSVDIAINHDHDAIAMHKANHPNSKHYCESVWDVDPVEACAGRPVGLAWFSPDCKHFSKAKGGKPKDKNIRGLAWIAVKWAKLVRPRVIMLENVEEFKTWGPLLKDGMPDITKKGQTFTHFVKQLKKLGYAVDWRELKACDYGAPTTRKRFFLIARCDGKAIVWPEPTHGDPDTLEVRFGLMQPWRTAAEIIDWSLPCHSIFNRKKPLSENTLERISRGLKKFVLEAEEPYVVEDKAFFLQHYYGTQGGETRGSSMDEPVATIPTANRFGLVCAFIGKSYGIQHSRSVASSLNEGIHTITARQVHSLVTAFLIKYYGTGIGQSINDPLHTITSKDTFGLVTVQGETYEIHDIGMRMLQPHELFAATGFPEDYIIDRDFDGKAYSKEKQVARVGNAVPPPFAKALVMANLPEMCGKVAEMSA